MVESVMRRGKSSGTAEFIAMTRALGHLAPEVPGFADPIAVRLLAPEWRRKVERATKRLPGSPYTRWPPRAMGVFNQFRTVVLDRAIAAAPIDQLVILGAGLDGRAYRLEHLRATTVFEVDHPDTQAAKRARVKDLTPVAREVRFVPVDFEQDELGDRLAAAGHDRSRPTLWLLEGVTMYLSRQEVARTIARLASLSAPGSRLALTYLAPAKRTIVQRLFLELFGLVTGEPIRSAFEPADLETVTRTAGWHTLSDTGLADWKRDLGSHVPIVDKEIGLQRVERVWIGRVS